MPLGSWCHQTQVFLSHRTAYHRLMLRLKRKESVYLSGKTPAFPGAVDREGGDTLGWERTCGFSGAQSCPASAPLPRCPRSDRAERSQVRLYTFLRPAPVTKEKVAQKNEFPIPPGRTGVQSSFHACSRGLKTIAFGIQGSGESCERPGTPNGLKI